MYFNIGVGRGGGTSWGLAKEGEACTWKMWAGGANGIPFNPI